MALIIALQAKNCNGLTRLHIGKSDDGGVDLALTGKHKGEDIQIDFDGLNKDDVETLIILLQKQITNK